MSDTNEYLHRLVQLAQEMIALSSRSTTVPQDRGCSVIFGKLRDAGHELRRLAEKELSVHKAQPRKHKKPSSPETRAQKPVPATSPYARTILIVEDDPDIVTFLRRWFEDQGFATMAAVNGLAAIEAATFVKPDLITLDMSMPVKSGVSTYRDLKEDPSLRSIPVIVITGLGEVLAELRHRQLSVPDPEGLIAKPIDLSLLTQTVNRILTLPPDAEGRDEIKQQTKQNRRNR